MDLSQIAPGSLQGVAFRQAPVGTPTSAPTRVDGGFPDAQLLSGVTPEAEGPNALSILRQEIQQVLASSFRIRVDAALPAYAAASEPVSTDSVATEAANAGKIVAERAPLQAQTNIVKLRSKVETAASEVREIVGEDKAIDDAMDCICEEYDKLEEDAARNTQSSASVLSYESTAKQRSTIRIRTQEGDVVRLDLRRMEQSSVRDVSMSDDSGSFSSTEIELNSRTRTMLRVKGDLNEAEFAAIQSVFEQAESIANEFFNGDLAAAFDMAAGIEFDSEQLARVNMRFREKIETNLAYASIGQVSAPAAPAAEAVEPVVPPEVVNRPAPSAEPAPKPVIEPPTTDEPVVVDTPLEVAPESAPAAPEISSDALDGFFDLLSQFLNGINEGFEASEGSFRYFYSQSFKLEILKSVMSFEAPEASASAAETAATVIDSVAESAED